MICKVLQLGKFYPIVGGIEKVEYILLTGLSEKGIKCDMLCAAVDGKGETISINQNAKLITTKTWTKKSATMISPSMITTLRKICKNYDIIHVHHPDPMACLALFLSGYKGRVVLHWHSDIVKQKFLLKLFMPLQNWLIRRADVIIGTSPVYTSESPFLTHVKDKIINVPIGVDAVEANMADVEKIKSQYPNKKIVFALGRLVEYKGFEYLIDAAKYLNDDYMILIGGGGPLKETLKQKITELQLDAKVKLIGFIEDAMLPSYFKACDVFCLPSIYKTEAFGLVQIEAMSCGKPVVATRIPGSGVSWVNKHGESGLNVATCNSKELAEAITTLLSNQDTYKQYSENARKRYLEVFTTNMMIENCRKIYAKFY